MKALNNLREELIQHRKKLKKETPKDTNALVHGRFLDVIDMDRKNNNTSKDKDSKDCFKSSMIDYLPH